jgi:ATP-dependent Clp protease adapter protein ClpS
MQPRTFFVFLNEIRQNFVFGDRFRDSYTRTVTMSDGSVRTVKLTPVIRNGEELVELDDGGHITYMGLNGTTTNATLMIQLHSRELSYPDEKSCAVAMLDAPVVQALYLSLGTDPDSIKARLSELQPQGDNPDIDYILTIDSAWHRHSRDIPLELRLLVGLVVHGSPAVKQALAPQDGQPGDVPFFVARKRRETELQSLWPVADQQTGRVVLLDDPFTSMRTAADALESSFGLDPKSAHGKMLEVHRAGSCVLELGPGSDVADTCRRLNADWRSRGLSLYCHPEPVA